MGRNIKKGCRSRFFPRFLLCPRCKDITTIQIEGKTNFRKAGHIKDLWCYKCLSRTSRIELSSKQVYLLTHPEQPEYESFCRWLSEQCGRLRTAGVGAVGAVEAVGAAYTVNNTTAGSDYPHYDKGSGN